MPIERIIPPGSVTKGVAGFEHKQPDRDFGSVFTSALEKVNGSLLNAEQLSQDFTLGKNVELHQVVLAAERATMALQLTIQIRNKAIEAYQEIMRMQV